MKFTLKTVTACCAFALCVAASAMADQPQDVVTGPGNQPVRSIKFGNCVQTKWSSPSDPCAPAPAPKPEVVVQQPPAVQPVSQLAREQLTIYFAFNKAELTEESTAKLDQIADAVNRSPKVTKVDIVGYTDQIGSNSYNDKLSLRRAHAVNAYLDTKTHIPVSVLGLRGMGKADPVVNCKGVKKRKEKIACMAKDRRTEIEFEFQK
jgi:OOP family OmpA-OmpF porin